MKTLEKVSYILNRQQKIAFIGIFVLIAIGSVLELLGVSAILPLAQLIMTPEIISQNATYLKIMELFELHDFTGVVLLYAVGLAILYIVKNVFLFFSMKMQLRYTQGVNKEIAIRLMDGYLHQDYLFHVTHNVADLQRNISTDVRQFSLSISCLMSLAVEGITCTLLITFLLVKDVVTTILLAGILIVAALIFLYIYKKLQVKYGIIYREAGARLNKWLLQSFGGIKEIKVMNREEFFLNNYEIAYQKGVDANIDSILISSLPKYVMESICMCSLLLVIILRVLQGKSLTEFAEVLIVFAVAAVRMLPAFNRISDYFGKLLFNKAGTDSVYHDLKEVEQLRQKREEKKSEEILTFQKVISVENVTFRYPETENKIFDNASLSIQKNKSVAFIGSSGAGKTTLVDIIIGLLEPEAGDVKVDGVSVFNHLDAWHKAIGYIPQMIYLMDDTIRANVVFGVTDDEIDDEKVWKALERAELADYVRGLKDGIYTEVGDRGVRLSGGQRQRIGIARALYNEPDVLILDEATSALDNETESAVMESIEHLQGQTTLIIIAHRLTTIQNCDEVYEIENGAINRKK